MAAHEVISVSEMNVVGILAQMGSRVITEVSNIMFEEFSQNFQARLEQSARSRPQQAPERQVHADQAPRPGLAGGARESFTHAICTEVPSNAGPAIKSLHRPVAQSLDP